MPVHPRDFVAEFVDPALELWRQNQSVTHLAVHAIAQLDTLAEVAALWTLLRGRPTLNRGEATDYRRDLATREPILGQMHDAHDSHKHGRLGRADKNPNPQGVSQGQRPETAVREGFFLDVSFFDSLPTRYSLLVVRLNDGTEEEVYGLLHRAREAWDRELVRLGL